MQVNIFNWSVAVTIIIHFIGRICRFTWHFSSPCTWLAISSRRCSTAWRWYVPWNTRRSMPRRRLPRSTACRWCWVASKCFQRDSFPYFEWLIYIYTLFYRLVVSQHQRALHIVFPHQFLDSPEWFGVSTDDYFQVGVHFGPSIKRPLIY